MTHHCRPISLYLLIIIIVIIIVIVIVIVFVIVIVIVILGIGDCGAPSQAHARQDGPVPSRVVPVQAAGHGGARLGNGLRCVTV